MKIACLQFAPQVGDIDNNLNRADAVLSRANVEDLLGLDLLVLPELAFSGYNFNSLRSIAPFLEPSGSGISSLWARTTALRHDCVVVVGYPEKVDVTPKWPASPEYYNSALVVNSDGETIANYRKSFLYHTDETWALEGRDGFFHDEIPGIGSVSMGICMDINPYKFEAPWDDFEFGWHVVDAAANVVILTMAWHTHHDTSLFSRRPQEPDLETLVYWVQRLEPLLSAKKEEEVIVIFCNRTGSEDDLMYAGTSAVLGIKRGEVFVYGLLGRGVKELLVVDTSRPPVSKLTS
ncbi:carbon-nitrogen hydrolase, partial [Podospora conica]